jgi:hypothetical protein
VVVSVQKTRHQPPALEVDGDRRRIGELGFGDDATPEEPHVASNPTSLLVGFGSPQEESGRGSRFHG